MIHHVRAQYTDNGNLPFAAITLPDVPGVTVTTDRSDTAPRSPMIRANKRKPTGAAVRKPTPYDVLRAACIEIAEGEG